ncbi:MAG: hypothetical protein WBY75_01715, partial [Terracidiphilus sp.]
VAISEIALLLTHVDKVLDIVFEFLVSCQFNPALYGVPGNLGLSALSGSPRPVIRAGSNILLRDSDPAFLFTRSAPE